MSGHFVHHFDLEIGRVFGLPVYWYGAVYTVGFLGIFLWLWFRRPRLGWSRNDVFAFSVYIAIGALLGGRAFDIAVYELAYYRAHPLDALNWWKGGLASHGVLLGCLTAVVAFCLLRKKSFLQLADEIVVPTAFLLAVGRLGNFIEGGVVGTPTQVPWAVIYQSLDGPRHPVALYESAKNFIIVPVLLIVLRFYPAGRGVALATFVFLYAFLRFLVDLFRDYESDWLGLDRGQYFNLAMAIVGLGLLVWFARNKRPIAPASPLFADERRTGWIYPSLFVLLLLYPLGIPTSWTQKNIEEKRMNASQVAPIKRSLD